MYTQTISLTEFSFLYFVSPLLCVFQRESWYQACLPWEDLNKQKSKVQHEVKGFPSVSIYGKIFSENLVTYFYCTHSYTKLSDDTPSILSWYNFKGLALVELETISISEKKNKNSHHSGCRLLHLPLRVTIDIRSL